MWDDRNDVIKLAKEFTSLCDQNDIWYTVDTGTLLGTIRNQGMIPWDDDFDVMMSYDSYQKLKTLFPERVIDTDTKDYPLLLPKFLVNKKDFLKSAVFVDIFIVLPTNQKGIKRFTSLKSKTRFAMQTIHSKWQKFNLGSKIFYVLSWPLKWIPKKISITEAVNMLSVPEDEITHFYTIDNPIDPIKINKQKILSMKRERAKFENFDVWVPVEYKSILIKKYTQDYMVPKKEERSIEHVNAISIKKVNRKNKDY